MSNTAPLRDIPLLPADVTIDKRADGALIARSTVPIGTYPAKTTAWLDHWAATTPDAVFMAQRDGKGPWHIITYAQMHAAARAIGTSLLQRALSPARPIAILSGNDLGQALMGFGAQYAGIPFAPISPAYSLMSEDHAKLRYVLGLLDPGMIYVSSAKPFQKAIDACVPADVEIVHATDAPANRPRTTLLADLMQTPATSAIDAANAVVGPDTVVKFLFTSGSTGNPKAVINTQRMLTADIVMVAQGMPFLAGKPPVLVDWMPWSHTFAGNHNVNLVLMHGGTFHIDDGRPMPGAVEQTVTNLKEISPTIYFNVPRGYEALLPSLRADAQLRKSFFARLDAMFYAGASLPQHVWDGLQACAVQETGHQIRIITGLGSTETAPGCIASTNKCTRSGMVGLPLPGVELKLVPNGGKLEARVRGPNITPGYWKLPAVTKDAFDEEGFYKLGDALKFADPADPSMGFVFDGRIAEDFKLTTGTWVSVGPLRAEIIQALAPLVRDCVITGHDRGHIGALLVPEPEACRKAAGLAADASLDAVYASPTLTADIKARLAALAAGQKGSSTRIARTLILTAPLSLDTGEVTDKGSVNQRAVIANRAALVEALYTDQPGPGVIAV